MSERHVLVISHDRVGRCMAGPGIRYRELARVLASQFAVTLAVPGEADLDQQPFAVWPYRRREWASLAEAANRAHVIVAPGDSLAEFPALEKLSTPLVVDGYDPHTLETLALWRAEPPDVQAAHHQARLDVQRRQCQAADLLLCASERQRDWWLGLLEQAGRINPRTYAADPSLRSLIAVVPFGLPSEPPQARRPVIRGVWPGVGADDWIVLWGGGLWEWLDPLTAVRAARRLVDGGLDRVRLVFPGTRHPNPAMPDMPLRARTVALADELGLSGRYVFWGDWVAYEDWPAVLLEADVGLSLHPDTVETRLAFRSRVLDYIWAGLPMVLTRGDATADLAVSYGLGALVEFGDEAAVAEALARLRNEPLPAGRFDAARRDLTWERAAAPLVAFCQDPRHAPDRGTTKVTKGTKDTKGGDRMNVSVIVLTWNGKAYIEACLAALLAQDYPAFEVLVVDNGSVDGTPDLVAERFPKVRLFRNGRNLGFAAGNNVGLRAASGDLLVLLNDDTEVWPGFLSALARAFDDPGVGLAGCKLLYPDGAIQHAGGYLFGPRGEADHLGRLAPDDGRFDEPTEPEFVTGAALAIRRSALTQIGPLDEGFTPIYYEDVDWCFRARAAGWRVVYAPQAVVTHHESVTADRSSHRHKLNLHHGRVRFLFKHWPLDRLLEEFGPAEAAWVAAMPRITELMAARGAYLQVALDLPGILAFRASSEAEALALSILLSDLRTAALTSLETQAGAPALLPPAAEAPPGPPSPPAREEAPLPQATAQPRGLLARLRRLWTGLRYLDVLPDLVRQVQQHDQVLARHDQVLARHDQVHSQQGELVGWVSRRVDGLERRSAEQGELLAGQARDLAENIRELTAIAARLARTEPDNG